MNADAIRPMSEADLPRVGAIVDATDMFPSALLPEMTAPYFADPAGAERWLVGDVGGVVAVAYYVPEMLTDGTWNLLLIAVDPEQQGRGIGRRMMRYVEGDLVSRAQRLLLVETSGKDGFAGTRAFYDGLGYAREARIRDYYALGDDKVIFAKALA